VSADRNLLFGVLALQMDFISRDALVEAMHAWVLDKKKPISQILVERGALRGDSRSLLEPLVEKHLEMHGGEPQKSLAAVTSLADVRDELGRIADPEVHASLTLVPETRPPSTVPEADLFATRSLSASPASPSGCRFRVLRPHAKGGLGEVFVARDEELGREVALKEIQGKNADDPSSRARFLMEAEITGNLEHPGIVPVYALGTYPDGRPYYAMRFIRGDSLHTAIRHFHQREDGICRRGDRGLEQRKLLGRFVGVCNAVAYAHSRGVLHRDLKPANVMLGKFGETLVVDWGLAKPAGDMETARGYEEGALRPASGSGSAVTQMGSAVGTPDFMPREQAAGRLDLLGPASDVYSLGATLYCLLTGKTPFPGNDVGDILQRVQKGDLLPLRRVNKEVPASLAAVCLKAMALKPEERYASAQALAEEIEHWLADEPVAAYREPWAVRAGRWVRRHRTKVTAGVAAVAVAAVCLTVATVLLAKANGRERQARAEAIFQRDEARKEKERADQERDEARRQKERADRNLANARKAVEAYCTTVANDERLRQGDFHLLRRRVLATAVPFYKEFVQQQGDDPELQSDQGRAFDRLASIRFEIGEMHDAVADCRQAIAIFTRLARAYPAAPSYREAMSRSQGSLGWYQIGLGQYREAEATYRAAIPLWEGLVADFPSSSEYAYRLGNSHNNLAVVLRNLGRYKEAESHVRRTLLLQEKLVASSPAVVKYRQELARYHSSLGMILVRLGRLKETEAVYRKSVELREKLAADFPAEPAYRLDLSISYNSLGGLLRATSQPKEAEAAYRLALAIREKLVRDFRHVPRYRITLAETRMDLGRLLQAQGRPQEAEAAYRQALAIQEGLARDFPEHGELLYDAACICALASASVKDKVSLKDHFAVQAIEFLSKARGTDYFKDPTKVAHMKKDSDLNSLRSRSDYKKLVAELEAAQKGRQ
jgi:serine/threonine-protein kinase